jgi:hypothetical protein
MKDSLVTDKLFLLVGGVILLSIIVVTGSMILSKMSEGVTTTSQEDFSYNFTATSLSNVIADGEISSATIEIYNKTWIDLDQSNAKVDIPIPEQKNTISFWYKNSTHTWKHYVWADGLVYINGSANPTWTFTPYRILGNNLTIGYDGTSYYNISVDSIRVYSAYLNSSDVATLYSGGRE